MVKKQFAVIGLGRFGSNVALELIAQGHEVLGIDRDEESVNALCEKLTHTVVADSTDEEVLRSLGIRNFDCVVVAIGDNIQACIMTAILLKDMGVKTVVAKAISALQGRVLTKLGVDRVVHPERDMGIRVAHQLVTPNLLDFIELSNDHAMAEISVPKRMSGLSIKQLDVRAKFGCSIVAIHRNAGEISIAPNANDLVYEKDVMVIIGTNVQIERFEKEVVG